MKTFFALILLLSVQGFASSAGAQVHPTIEYKYYDVNIADKNNDQIVEATFGASPVKIQGKQYLGLADCENRFNLNTTGSDDGSCKVKNYDLNLICTVTLPRFNGGSTETRERLNTFLDNLKSFELRQCDTFAEYTGNFVSWLSEERVYACASMAADIKKVLDGEIAKAQTAMEKDVRESVFGQSAGVDLEWHLADEADRKLMADGMVAPPVKIEPQIEYSHKDIALKADDKEKGWKNELGALDWRIGYNYKSRRKAGDTCRVLKYDAQVVCKITLPRFNTESTELKPELEAQEAKARETQAARCTQVLEEAEEFTRLISGDNTFNCDSIRDDIEGLYFKTVRQVKKELNEPDDSQSRPSKAEALGKVKRNIKYRYYNVRIKDPAEAEQAALKATRVGRKGKPSLSAIQWQMKYSGQPEKRDDGRCGLNSAEVTVNCEIMLPQFKSENPEASAAGEELVERLKAGELKRCDIVQNKAEQFAKWLDEDRSFHCSPMSNLIRGEFNRWMKAAEEAEEAFEG